MPTARVLVVDDECDSRSAMCVVLNARGFETDEAADGADALEKLAASRYDAMVLDLLMPRLGAAEVVESLAGSDPDMLARTVIATAHEDSTKVKGLHGGCRVIAKPIEYLSLVAAVESCMRRGAGKLASRV